MEKSIWFTLLFYEYLILFLYAFIISYDERLSITTVFLCPIPYLKKVKFDFKKTYFSLALAIYALFGCLIIEGIIGLFSIPTSGEWLGWIKVKFLFIFIPTILIFRSFFRKKCLACDGTKTIKSTGLLRSFLQKNSKCFACYSSGNYNPKSQNGLLVETFNHSLKNYLLYSKKSKKINAALKALAPDRSTALLNKLETSKKQIDILYQHYTENLTLLIPKYKELRTNQETLKRGHSLKQNKELKARNAILRREVLAFHKSTVK